MSIYKYKQSPIIIDIELTGRTSKKARLSVKERKGYMFKPCHVVSLHVGENHVDQKHNLTQAALELFLFVKRLQHHKTVWLNRPHV